MQTKKVRSVYGPRLLIAIGIVLALGILLFIHNSLSGSVTGIKQVFAGW